MSERSTGRTRRRVVGLAALSTIPFAGCSSLQGATDSASSDGPSAGNATGATTTAGGGTESGGTSDETSEGTTTPEGPPGHDVHLSVENESAESHDVAVRVEKRGGKTVFGKSAKLGPDEESLYRTVIPRPTSDPVEYRVSATVDGKTAGSSTVTVYSAHRVHAVVVYVLGSDEVQFSVAEH